MLIPIGQDHAKRIVTRCAMCAGFIFTNGTIVLVIFSKAFVKIGRFTFLLTSRKHLACVSANYLGLANETNGNIRRSYAAFSFFNRELFGSKLSDCLILLHRHRSAYGYFWAEQFTGKVHEIALNPTHIRTRKPRDTFGTLAHEMVHQLQQEHGKPPKGAYHNKQWAAMMKEIGLQPDDGEGNETGRYVSHKIVKDGRFDIAFTKFSKLYDCNLLGTMPNVKKAKCKTSKFKFSCSECEQAAWAKQTAKLICGNCNIEMEEV